MASLRSRRTLAPDSTDDEGRMTTGNRGPRATGGIEAGDGSWSSNEEAGTRAGSGARGTTPGNAAAKQRASRAAALRAPYRTAVDGDPNSRLMAIAVTFMVGFALYWAFDTVTAPSAPVKTAPPAPVEPAHNELRVPDESGRRRLQQQSDPAITEKFKAGVQHFQAGNMPEAEASFRGILEQDAKHENAAFNLGLVLTFTDRRAEASRMFQRTLQINPDHIPAMVNLGAALLATKQVDDAARTIALAVQKAPTHAQAHRNLGVLLTSYHVTPGTLAPSVPDGHACMCKAQALVLAQLNQDRVREGRCPLRLAQSLEQLGQESTHWSSEDLVGDSSTPGIRYGVGLPRAFDGQALDPQQFTAGTPAGVYSERYVYKETIMHVTIGGNEPIIYSDCAVFGRVHGCFLPFQTSGKPFVDAGAEDPVFDTMASVIGMAMDNYYHWITESLPRLLWLQSTLVAEPNCRILVPGIPGVRKFVDETLHYLMAVVGDGRGGHWLPEFDVDHRLVYYEPFMRFHVHKLYTVDWRPTDGEAGQEFLPPKAGLNLVRSTFVPHPISFGNRNVLLWASRNEPGATDRTVANEQQVLAVLREIADNNNLELFVFKGYEAPFNTTVAAFSHARMVVGMHGAALSNAVFCAPGSALVEITMPEPFYRMYMHLAAAQGLHYWAVTGVPHNSFQSALKVDLTLLRKTVTAALARPLSGAAADTK